MAEPVSLPWWKAVRALAPAVLFWAALVGWLAYLLSERARQSQEQDEALVREWIDEARSFRKTLPELVREYLQRLDEPDGDATRPDVQRKAEEIQVQIKALVDPVRAYQGQLPSFVEVYRVEVRFLNRPEGAVPTIAWDSPAPRPKPQNRSQLRTLDHPITGAEGQPAAVIR